MEKLALNGCMVTVYALNCQVAMAETIVQGAADYVIAAKGNQQAPHDALQRYLACQSCPS